MKCKLIILIFILLLLSINVVKAVPTPPLINKQHLICWYTFDEANNTIAIDHSGHVNGSIYGDPSIVKGRYGYALYFNKSYDYIITNFSTVDPRYSITVTAWVYISSTDTTSVIVNRRSTNVGSVADGWRSWTIEYGWIYKRFIYNIALWNSSNLTGKLYTIYVPAQPSHWYFVAMTWSNKTNLFDVYLDGKLVGSIKTAYPEIYYDHDDPNASLIDNRLFIGDFDGGYAPGNPIIDEVRIYNCTLNATEIHDMYEALRVNLYDEETFNPIIANVTIENENYSIPLQVDNITHSAVLFYANLTQSGKYIVTASAAGYDTRHRVVVLGNGLQEINMYLPKSTDAVLNTIIFHDLTGLFKPDTSTAFIEKGGKIIDEQPLSPDYKYSVYLLENSYYVLGIRNNQVGRTIGLIRYSPDGYINVYIQSLLNISINNYVPVIYNISTNNNSIIVEYNTTAGNTSKAELLIYNSSGALVNQQVLYTPSGRFTFIKNPNESYQVVLKIDNNLYPVNVKILASNYNLKIETNVAPLLQLPTWLREMLFGGLCVFVALLFKRSNVPIGLMLSFSLAALFTQLGILPLSTPLLWILAMLVGISFFVWWRERT